MALTLALVMAACGDANTEAQQNPNEALDASQEGPLDTALSEDTGAEAPLNTGDDDSPPVNPGPEPTPGPEVTSNCSAPSSAIAHQPFTIDVNGITRTYRLSVPATDAGTALSLMLAFHGGGDAGLPFPQQGLFQDLGQQHGIINVYPDEMLFPGNEGGWLLNTGEGRMQDIDFIEAVIAHLSSAYCLDQRHMYAVGYSLGGMYSYEAACHLNHRLSGIVSVAGSMPVNPTSCELTRPLPILHVHGTDDTIIPYYEDWDWKEWDAVGTMRSVPSLIEHWAERYDCQTLDNERVGDVQHVVRGECDEGVRIEHYAITGLGHDWPQIIEGRPFPEVVWELMSAFRRP